MVTRIKVDGYTYEQPSSTELEFTKYIDSETNVITPTIESIEFVTLTINPTPADATVVLTAEGYSQEGNSITVLSGTEVTYTISRTGYTTVTNTIEVLSTQTLSISLPPITYTFTLDPNPADATVILEATGYTQSGNHIVVPYGTEVIYEVSKLGYSTSRGLLTVYQSSTLHLNLVKAASAAKFMNYGTCVVCFQTQALRVFDLEYVYRPYTAHYDYGTNLTTGYFDEHIDCGGLDD